MQVKIDIGFEQLVSIAKKLPDMQWQALKKEVESNNDQLKGNTDDLETFLLNGPTYSKEQLAVIEGNRKNINKWRTI